MWFGFGLPFFRAIPMLGIDLCLFGKLFVIGFVKQMKVIIAKFFMSNM
jgi:hypothetical protein